MLSINIREIYRDYIRTHTNIQTKGCFWWNARSLQAVVLLQWLDIPQDITSLRKLHRRPTLPAWVYFWFGKYLPFIVWINIIQYLYMCIYIYMFIMHAWILRGANIVRRKCAKTLWGLYAVIQGFRFEILRFMMIYGLKRFLCSQPSSAGSIELHWQWRRSWDH